RTTLADFEDNTENKTELDHEKQSGKEQESITPQSEKIVDCLEPGCVCRFRK
ncbi:unnamed protein product, partial [Didymodactylos carnosus]